MTFEGHFGDLRAALSRDLFAIAKFLVTNVTTTTTPKTACR